MIATNLIRPTDVISEADRLTGSDPKIPDMSKIVTKVCTSWIYKVPPRLSCRDQNSMEA